jgi:hypothetical protein
VHDTKQEQVLLLVLVDLGTLGFVWARDYV